MKFNDDVLQKLRELEPDFLEPARVSGYVCPVCGSGSGKNGTGIVLNPHTRDGVRRWKCFNNDCPVKDDVIGLWAYSNHLDPNRDYVEAVKGLAHYAGLDAWLEVEDGYTNTFSLTAKSKAITPDSLLSSNSNAGKSPSADGGEKSDMQKNVEAAREAIDAERVRTIQDAQKYIDAPAALAYLQKRGLSLEIARSHGVGYLEQWRASDNAPYTPRLIIPTRDGSYLARDTRDFADIPEEYREKAKRFAKMKSGPVHMFNSEALLDKSHPIAVTEGEISAMSVEQAGHSLGVRGVGLGSTSQVRAFLQYLESLSLADRPKHLILAFDNDNAGRQATRNVTLELSRLNINYTALTFDGDDPNDALVKDPVKFASAVNAAVSRAMQSNIGQCNSDAEASINLSPNAPASEYDAYSGVFVGRRLSRLVALIEANKNTSYVSTGFPVLDDLLAGGLRGGLYVVGAISSLGKTSFTLQVADQIAALGQDVIYFSLEMAETELMAKSISRLSYLLSDGNTGYAKSTLGVLDGCRYKSYSDKEKTLIQNAMDLYSEKCGDHLIIYEGMGNIGTTQIRQAVLEHQQRTGHRPVVFVDYLQILAPITPMSSDKQNADKSVTALKVLSRDANIPVICISSFNRENYAAPLSMSAFKESGGIEYSADVLIGLQYQAMADFFESDAVQNGGSKREAAEAARRMREVTAENTARAIKGEGYSVQVNVLKNRNGAKGTARFDFFPKFNFFDDISNGVLNLWRTPKKDMLHTEPMAATPQTTEILASVPDPVQEQTTLIHATVQATVEALASNNKVIPVHTEHIGNVKRGWRVCFGIDAGGKLKGREMLLTPEQTARYEDCRGYISNYPEAFKELKEWAIRTAPITEYYACDLPPEGGAIVRRSLKFIMNNTMKDIILTPEQFTDIHEGHISWTAFEEQYDAEHVQIEINLDE